jgi:hypothetical protein
MIIATIIFGGVRQRIKLTQGKLNESCSSLDYIALYTLNN